MHSRFVLRLVTVELDIDADASERGVLKVGRQFRLGDELGPGGRKRKMADLAVTDPDGPVGRSATVHLQEGGGQCKRARCRCNCAPPTLHPPAAARAGALR
eukprot:gene10910-biopygen18345